MKKILGLIVAIFILQGCQGAPVGWGGTYDILQANPKSITIRFDPMVGASNKIWAPATEHCQKHGKDPVPTVEKQQGVLKIQTFECK